MDEKPREMSRFVGVFIADNRPGLLNDAATLISQEGGNVLVSHVDVLMTKALIYFLFEMPDALMATAMGKVKALLDQGQMRYLIERVLPAGDPGDIPMVSDCLEIRSADFVGVLALLSSVLHKNGVDIISQIGELRALPTSQERTVEFWQLYDMKRPCSREAIEKGLRDIAGKTGATWRWIYKSSNTRLAEMLFESNWRVGC